MMKLYSAQVTSRCSVYICTAMQKFIASQCTIYTIIALKSSAVSKLPVAILARSSREMSETVRGGTRGFYNRVKTSARGAPGPSAPLLMYFRCF